MTLIDYQNTKLIINKKGKVEIHKNKKIQNGILEDANGHLYRCKWLLNGKNTNWETPFEIKQYRKGSEE